MPTRVEVIANIDETIRDKTISDKIVNTEDADNRELILDYIDQEVATKVSADDLGAVAFSNDYNDLENKPDLDAKQDELVSGTNIKTINGNSILGSGDLAISGATAKTLGTVTPSSSTPYPISTFDISVVNTPLTNTGFALKDGTFNNGETQIVNNIGLFDVIVVRSGNSFTIKGTKYSTSSRYIVKPNESATFTYINGSWFVDSNFTKPLVYSANVFQSGTDDPIGQDPIIDTLSFDNSGTFIRSIGYERNGLGDYSVYLQNNNNFITTNFNKLSLNFSDAVCRVYSISTINLGGGIFQRKWKFKTYEPDGTLSDDLLLGNNGTTVTITLYKE
jgi:hypothetical protein